MSKKNSTSTTHSTLSALEGILRQGQSIELLKHLHILTVDGKLNQDTRRKLKQVNHLIQFIEPLILKLQAQGISPNLVDHGSGKSYLGFLLYDALFKDDDHKGSVWGIEHREDLIKTTQHLAQSFGFERMGFVLANTANAVHDSVMSALPKDVHIVTALHACNTATDDAIAFGLTKQVAYMVLIPCCQAEVASVLKQTYKNNDNNNNNNNNQINSSYPFNALWQRPLHTRELGSQLTNVLRCLQLESAGYQVTITELVGWEHSLKNELIIAQRYTDSQLKLNSTQQLIKTAKQHLSDLLKHTHLSALEHRFLKGID